VVASYVEGVLFMKRRIIIVDCNAKVGGIQKALIALLKQIHDKYEITLLLLNKHGVLLNDIPKDVRVIETRSDFRYMGMAQADCKNVSDRIRRGIYVLVSKVLGQNVAVKLASLTLWHDKNEEYDIAVSYSHVFDVKTFFGGTAEYVLRAVRAKHKICYIHCDYLNSGTRSNYSDHVYSKFDSIFCVSESTKEHFRKAMPQLNDRTYAVLNAIDEIGILKSAHDETIEYDRKYLNMVSIARLTEEKGIERIVDALRKMDTSAIRYYIVGDGKERSRIEQMIADNHLEEVVTLRGEDVNPYRHMLNADLLVVPSYHEAAPVVFQEAKVMGLPVLTTRTTSADEMIGTEFGFVVENNDEALLEKLKELIENPQLLKQNNNRLQGSTQFSENAFSRMISDLLEEGCEKL